MPLNVIPAPSGDKVVVVLSGWREQGIQVVDLKTRRVTQTLVQDGAFYGAAFSPDGNTLYVSGGNMDCIVFLHVERWGRDSRREAGAGQNEDFRWHGTSYPAGLAVAANGKFVYVAENVGDHLAVVDRATGEIVQRLPTDHYPYGVILDNNGHLYVSAWGGTTVADFHVLADGKLARSGAWKLAAILRR